MAKYEDSCFLSKAQDKKSSNSPDYYGKVEISADTIRYLAGQVKSGDESILRVALWRKENDRGVYLSMQLSVPQENQQREERRPAAKVARRRDDDDEVPF